MTINIRAASAPDLTVDNDVINFDLKHLPGDKTLAGICWVVSGGFSAYEALLATLSFSYRLVMEKFPDYNIWLFIGDSVWQPDTRIVRYYKLWGALSLRGIKISHACNIHEVMHEEDGKLKFYGAIRLSELSVESVVKALIEEYCAYLAVLPNTVRPDSILRGKWSGELTEDRKIITSIIENDGLLIKRYGGFDDRERGVVAVGQPELVRLFLS